MRPGLKLAIAAACLCSILPGGAVAKSRHVQAPPPAGQAANGSGFQVKLPADLTTNKDWLDVGGEVPVGTTDRYFVEQQDFREQDPLRYTEAGSILDQYE